MHDKDTKLYYSNLTPSFASDTSHGKAVIFIQFSWNQLEKLESAKATWSVLICLALPVLASFCCSTGLCWALLCICLTYWLTNGHYGLLGCFRSQQLISYMTQAERCHSMTFIKSISQNISIHKCCCCYSSACFIWKYLWLFPLGQELGFSSSIAIWARLPLPKIITKYLFNFNLEN